MSDITEKTKVSLFAAIVGCSALLGGMAWLTAIYDQVAYATKVNEKQDEQLRELSRLTVETHDVVMELKIKMSRCR